MGPGVKLPLSLGQICRQGNFAHSGCMDVSGCMQAEVFNGAILQQTFVVEYVVENNMCMDCNRSNANPNSWVACVQVGRLSMLSYC